MYNKIYEFCKVKNTGICFKNGTEPTPRVKFILSLCDEMGLEYELDEWGEGKEETSFDYDILDVPELKFFRVEIPRETLKAAEVLYSEYLSKTGDFLKAEGFLDPDDLTPDEMDMLGDDYGDLFNEYTKKLKDLVGELKESPNKFFNIILKGSSDKFVVAHHDIVNPNSDNANDNSCSVINALAIKKKRPNVNVVILDGEEVGGIGSKRLSERINSGEFKCKWILNLELTGKGGKNFFVGAMGTNLTQWISNRFECPIVKVPFNDSVIFKKYGIDSAVINPLPITQEETPIQNKDGEYLNYKMLFNCHKMTDSVDTISTSDMQEFVEEVCLKIIDEA